MSQASTQYSRRHALRIGGGVLALVIAGGAGWLERRRGDSSGDKVLVPQTAPSTTMAEGPVTTAAPTELVESLDVAALRELDPAIADLGHRYLATYPSEADPATLLERLPAPVDNPIEAAAAVISGEFSRGETISIDGWVLAVSEARAAALVALVCVPGGEGAC